VGRPLETDSRVEDDAVGRRPFAGDGTRRRRLPDQAWIATKSPTVQARRTNFLGHASVESTRRYARLADNALLEVLREPAERASDKRATSLRGTKLSKRAVCGWALLDSNRTEGRRSDVRTGS
jgi:hypothetical protein